MEPSRYEKQVYEITTFGDTHRVYLVRDEENRQTRARGDRLCSDKNRAIQEKCNRRLAALQRFRLRADYLHGHIPIFRFNRRAKIQARIEAIDKRIRYGFDGDAWWFANWHKFKNELSQLPHLDDVLDSMDY